ncbi:MAG TPA: hypothetical protein VI854_08025 [Acidimicrobiia bacterium]|nr:hypothetical protein [Acidimicrobiia bacterium]
MRTMRRESLEVFISPFRYGGTVTPAGTGGLSAVAGQRGEPGDELVEERGVEQDRDHGAVVAVAAVEALGDLDVLPARDPARPEAGPQLGEEAEAAVVGPVVGVGAEDGVGEGEAVIANGAQGRVQGNLLIESGGATVPVAGRLVEASQTSAPPS